MPRPYFIKKLGIPGVIRENTRRESNSGPRLGIIQGDLQGHATSEEISKTIFCVKIRNVSKNVQERK